MTKDLAEDERERLELVEALAYATSGQSIHLVELCEGWLASGHSAQRAIVRYLVSKSNDVLFVIDKALLDRPPEIMQAMLHTVRGFSNEQEQESEAAFAEYRSLRNNHTVV